MNDQQMTGFRLSEQIKTELNICHNADLSFDLPCNYFVHALRTTISNENTFLSDLVVILNYLS